MNIARQNLHVQDLALYSDALSFSLNNVLKQASGVQEILVMNQALSNLENTVNSLLHANLLVIQNLVDAARGRVTSSLFPVKDLLHTLNIGKKDFDLCLTPGVYSITIPYWSLC